jgi:hypothetical protein
VIWDYPKREDMGKRRKILKHTFLWRVRKVVGTCNKKSHILFWYTTYFNCCFDFFNKTWDSIVILIHVFNNTKKHRIL